MFYNSLENVKQLTLIGECQLTAYSLAGAGIHQVHISNLHHLSLL